MQYISILLIIDPQCIGICSKYVKHLTIMNVTIEVQKCKSRVAILVSQNKSGLDNVILPQNLDSVNYNPSHQLGHPLRHDTGENQMGTPCMARSCQLPKPTTTPNRGSPTRYDSR